MHFYGKTSSVRCTNENHIAAVFVQSVFTDYSTRAANLIASEWSYKNQNSSYWGRFQWNFDQGKGNLVRVSGKVELSEFKLTESKWLTGGVKSKGNGTRVSVEFERFYCSYLTATVFCNIFTGLSLRSVRSRFAFLKALNSDVERLLLPVTDFRAADSYSLSTATLLREARGLLFYHTKVALLNHVLNHTAHRRAEDSPPEISLDPLEALEGNSIVV